VNCCRDKGSTKRTIALAAILATSWLAACGDEDPTATVTCAPPPDEQISVSTGPWDMNRRPIGLLNTWRLQPGSILKLSSATLGHARAGATLVSTLPVSESEFLPPQPEDWAEDVVGASIRVRFDQDVDPTLRPLEQELEREISRNSLIVISNVKRKVLRDPLALLNSDKSTVNLFRSASPESRFAVISAASYGDSVELYYSWAGLLVDTVRVHNLYVHIKYACPALTEINSLAQSSGNDVPIVLLYSAVKFDRTKRTVVLDPTPLDLTRLDLVERSSHDASAGMK
jgi:hypothetical protein